MQVQKYLEKPVGMVLYEWRDGNLGAACIQGGVCVIWPVRLFHCTTIALFCIIILYGCRTGPKGEGGLDDATGAGGRGGAGYTQTSKAVDLGKDLEVFYVYDLCARVLSTMCTHVLGVHTLCTQILPCVHAHNVHNSGACNPYTIQSVHCPLNARCNEHPGVVRANSDDHEDANWIVQQLSKTFKLPWMSK